MPRGRKHGGRKRGGVNRSSLAAREWFEERNIDLIEQILVRIPKLPPYEQVIAFSKLLPYVYPKLNSVTIEAKTAEQMEVERLSHLELVNKAKTILGVDFETKGKATGAKTKTKSEAAVGGGVEQNNLRTGKDDATEAQIVCAGSGDSKQTDGT